MSLPINQISSIPKWMIYHGLCPGRPLPKARYAALRTLHDPAQLPSKDSVLDSGALVLFFPSPKTVTGEDVLELHVHGGPAVVKAVLAAIPRCSTSPGRVRYAEPGEFTRRAFLNDRLDLTQIEALGDTLSATTEQQRRLSVRGTTNQLAKSYETWRQQLLYARGELEALIDFSEDQHFDESPAELASSVAAQVRVLQKRIEAHSANAVRGEMLRNGISIALLGAPNAGKSSLLNRIVGREAAIVSTEAGTTRDVVEVGIDLGGWYCRVGDTAGLRAALMSEYVWAIDAGHEASRAISGIEEEGIRRAKQRALESDVVIVVLSVEPSADGQGVQVRVDPEVTETAASCSRERRNVLVVVNKIDQIRESRDAIMNKWTAQVQAVLPEVPTDAIFGISCKDTTDASLANPDPGNIQAFLKGLIAKFAEITSPVIPELGGAAAESDPSIWQESLGATERHRLLLEDCNRHLGDFLSSVSPHGVDARNLDDDEEEEEEEEEVIDIVVAAESLRAAAECLAKITGKGVAGDIEEVLGVVFE
ncbi:hypothetical protein B0A49_10686, partial [Cryomyces minteri]